MFYQQKLLLLLFKEKLDFVKSLYKIHFSDTSLAIVGYIEQHIPAIILKIKWL